jgi:DNA repair protein RadC
MELDKKSKKELLILAQELADEFENKKKVIEIALDDLDSKEKIGQEHYTGIMVIEELFKELDEIEARQEKVIEHIKKN